MVTLTHDAVVSHDHSADGWVGTGTAYAANGQRKGSGDESFVRVGTG